MNIYEFIKGYNISIVHSCTCPTYKYKNNEWGINLIHGNLRNSKN